MANAWFRLYAEFATDPKVQMLSEALQRRFVMLLCIKCSNGDVTLQDEEVAFQLRISNEDWSDTKRVLMSKGLIDNDNKPCAWDKRQFRSDSSVERVRKHREDKKRSRNVTSKKSNGADTDTDTDTDSEVHPSGVGAAAQQPAGAKRKTSGTPTRATQMPEDFEPTESHKSLASELGISLTDAFSAFKDFHKSKGNTFKDWGAALNTWLRNERKFSYRTPPQKRSMHDIPKRIQGPVGNRPITRFDTNEDLDREGIR